MREGGADGVLTRRGTRAPPHPQTAQRAHLHEPGQEAHASPHHRRLGLHMPILPHAVLISLYQPVARGWMEAGRGGREGGTGGWGVEGCAAIGSPHARATPPRPPTDPPREWCTRAHEKSTPGNCSLSTELGRRLSQTEGPAGFRRSGGGRGGCRGAVWARRGGHRGGCSCAVRHALTQPLAAELVRQEAHARPRRHRAMRNLHVGSAALRARSRVRGGGSGQGRTRTGARCARPRRRTQRRITTPPFQRAHPTPNPPTHPPAAAVEWRAARGWRQ